MTAATTQKGITAVRVETHSATEQYDANIAEDTPDRATALTEERQDTGDADQAAGTEDVLSPADAPSDDTATKDAKDIQPLARERRIKWSHVLAFKVLPVLALLLAAAAGFAKWQDSCARMSAVARVESVAAAKESTTALLSYRPDSVEKDLGAARDRLTGKFQDSYTQLVHDVVIPGVKKEHISAIATVPAAALVSATPNHAVALVFVNQTVTIGNDAPTDTASTVRVTLDKVRDRWLISQFDPV